MTKNKSSLHQLENQLKPHGQKSQSQSGLAPLQESILKTRSSKCAAAPSTVRVETKSYDSGAPVALQYHRLGPEPHAPSRSLGAWDTAKSSLTVEPGQASFYTVEPFAMQQDSQAEHTQQPVPFQTGQPSGRERTVSQSSVVPEDLPVGLGIKPGEASVSESSSLAQNFDVGIKPLIDQAREQNSPAVRVTNPPQQSQMAEPQEQEQQETEPAPQQQYSHAVFDELSQNMQYANTFDLGSFELSKRFAAFERELDEEEACQTADDQQSTASPLSEADLIEDISAIKELSPTIKTPAPVVDVRTIQPAEVTDSIHAELETPQPQAAAAMTYAEPFGPAPGKNPGSTQADALKEAEKFANLKDPDAAFNLSHANVSKRMIELVKNPSLIQQGSLNLCGPAVFFYCLLQHDPVIFSKYVASLFTTGRGSLGGMTISPDDDLKNQQYNISWGLPPTDWIAMSALRDDQNWLLDYEGTPQETASAATSPAEMRSWLKTTGLYSKVQNDANWMVTKNVDHAKALGPDKKSTDVVLLINAHILKEASADNKKSDEFILSAFPNHYVGLETPVTEKNGQIQFTCWSWGDFYKVSVPAKTFKANYYGAVIAEK